MEKVLSISGEVDLLIRESEKKFHPDKPLPGKIAGSPDLILHAGYICNVANTIIEMFESGELKYDDVKIEDDEDVQD